MTTEQKLEAAREALRKASLRFARYTKPDSTADLEHVADLWFSAADALIAAAKEVGRQEEQDRLAPLIYIGEHRFPDLTWKSRCEEAVEDLRATHRFLKERDAAWRARIVEESEGWWNHFHDTGWRNLGHASRLDSSFRAALVRLPLPDEEGERDG